MKLYPVEMPVTGGTKRFYEKVVDVFLNHRIPFMVGGAFGFGCYTGLVRWTKDLDLFVLPQDKDRVLEVFQSLGYRMEVTDPLWIIKVLGEDDVFTDVIYRGGNGLGEVDKAWFENAREISLLGRKVKLCPAEECIWQKAFVVERHRFDGADIAHYFKATAKELDWERLLFRFGEKWRILFAHVLYFGFIYPELRNDIPEWVTKQLMKNLSLERTQKVPKKKLCQGTLLSRFSYLIDVHSWGYQDARFFPHGTVTSNEVSAWKKERVASDLVSMQKSGVAFFGDKKNKSHLPT